jgi:hypothetical protein
MSVLQPHNSRNCRGLGCSAFARHYLRNHYCFLFLWVLRCFSSPGSLLLFQEMLRLHRSGLPHSEIHGSICITNPRGLSQFITSFIASESLGIPHTLLFTSCNTKTQYSCLDNVQTLTLDSRFYYPAFSLYNMSKNVAARCIADERYLTLRMLCPTKRAQHLF